SRARSEAGGRPIITICDTPHHQGRCNDRLNPPFSIAPVTAVTAATAMAAAPAPSAVAVRIRVPVRAAWVVPRCP
ncbi:hypothetical protein, partial [Rhodococcus jostii]|uniref:hypothetical protein n=1 Tax=Rhodococcus jostii TaxID=132919 RepID=UPI00364027B5